MLLITRVGGVGERAGGLRRLVTSVEAGGAGCGWKSVNRSVHKGPKRDYTCVLLRFRPRDLSADGAASAGATVAAATAAAAAASSGVGSGGGGAVSSMYASCSGYAEDSYCEWLFVHVKHIATLDLLAAGSTLGEVPMAAVHPCTGNHTPEDLVEQP